MSIGVDGNSFLVMSFDVKDLILAFFFQYSFRPFVFWLLVHVWNTARHTQHVRRSCILLSTDTGGRIRMQRIFAVRSKIVNITKSVK